MTTESQFRKAYRNACRAVGSSDRLNQIIGKAYKAMLNDEMYSRILLASTTKPLPLNEEK
jgi:hypothetical protein